MITISRNVAQPASGPPTNNNAEIEAARTAIELAAGAGELFINIMEFFY